MQMVFQDPMSSLDPRQSVESLLVEGMRAHGLDTDKAGTHARLRELLAAVGLPPAALQKYPHEFSGGQRQRIGIARALSVDPDLIVADEPVSALDVSVQAQVINLLEDLQDELGLTYLVVAHDLAVVRHISDRIGVMYLGGLVEESEAGELYDLPLHPYTRALMSAVPVPDPVRRGHAASRSCSPATCRRRPTRRAGCRFHTRCPWRQPTRCDDGAAAAARRRGRRRHGGPPGRLPLGRADRRGRDHPARGRTRARRAVRGAAPLPRTTRRSTRTCTGCEQSGGQWPRRASMSSSLVIDERPSMSSSAARRRSSSTVRSS